MPRLESLSQVVFATRLRAGNDLLATTLDARLAGMLAGAHLLAAAEAAAVDALHLSIDPARETVLAAGFGMRRLAPATPGSEVQLDGCVHRLADTQPVRLEMLVVARAGAVRLAEIDLHFAVVERRTLQARLPRRRPTAEPMLAA